MKKLIVILMILTLVLCGCSKEEPKTQSTPTAAPTAEPTKAPTATPEPTKVPDNEDDLDKLLNEINEELDASRRENDKSIYNNLISWINIAFTDARIYSAPISNLNGIVIISRDGIQFKDVPDVISIAIIESIGDSMDSMKTFGEYSVGIEGDPDSGFRVKKIVAPE